MRRGEPPPQVMARPPLQPAFTPVKKEPDTDTTATAAARAPHPLTHMKHRQDRLLGTPTQPLLTPQTVPSATPRADSFTIKQCRELGVTPGTLPTSIMREPDADKGAGGRTLGTSPCKKRRVNCLSGTLSQPHFTPRTTTLSGISMADSSVDKWSEHPTMAHSVKRELVTDDGKDEGGKVVGRRRRPYPHARPTATETPTMWLNRGCLGRLLHDLARTHRWRDAVGVFSVLLPAIQHPDSFEEAHSIFVQNIVAYNQTQKPTLKMALVLDDAISDFPEACILLDFSGPGEGKVLDRRPLKLNKDDYERVKQIPYKKGGNFRDLKGVRVGTNNVVEFDTKIPRIYLESGKPLVPEYGMKFVRGKSLKPFGRHWGDETVPTVVTRAEAILHPKQARVLTVHENARLQGFPDYYRMDGPIKQRYKKVGNAAVPVARALGYSLGLAYLRKQEGSDYPLFVLPPNFFSPGQTESIARASSARFSAGEECRT